MEQETIRTRLMQLVQKSRKAQRLYSTAGLGTGSGSSSRSAGQLRGEGADFSEIQVGQWREVNADLLRELTSVVSNPSQRSMVGALFGLRDRFYSEWRRVEAELRVKQRELIVAAEQSDFTRSALLSRDLVLLKSREQATHAVQHELQDVIQKCRLVQPTIELSSDRAVAAQHLESNEGGFVAALNEEDSPPEPVRVGQKGAGAPLGKVLQFRKGF